MTARKPSLIELLAVLIVAFAMGFYAASPDSPRHQSEHQHEVASWR